MKELPPNLLRDIADLKEGKCNRAQVIANWLPESGHLYPPPIMSPLDTARAASVQEQILWGLRELIAQAPKNFPEIGETFMVALAAHVSGAAGSVLT